MCLDTGWAMGQKVPNSGRMCWVNCKRGVEDMLIACVDGLSGFKEAIQAVFPKTRLQRCILHQFRNSLKYVSYTEPS
jgi:transposase-like protein